MIKVVILAFLFVCFHSLWVADWEVNPGTFMTHDELNACHGFEWSYGYFQEYGTIPEWNPYVFCGMPAILHNGWYYSPMFRMYIITDKFRKAAFHYTVTNSKWRNYMHVMMKSSWNFVFMVVMNLPIFAVAVGIVSKNYGLMILSLTGMLLWYFTIFLIR